MDVTFGGSLLSGGRYYRNFTVNYLQSWTKLIKETAQLANKKQFFTIPPFGILLLSPPENNIEPGEGG